MARSLDEIRVLLLQARGTPEMEAQEQTCFLERCQIGRRQLDTINVAKERVSRSILDGYDAFMIGGAGEFSATERYPWTADVFDMLLAAYERGIPTFGSCWGHQMIAVAFGGEVIHDSARAEIGCGFVSLTASGRRDPLFADFPPSFRVNMGHHDRVTRLPEDSVELAYNDSQRFQAFRMKGSPMYGTQFHSELDAERERERLFAYRAYYDEVASDEAFDAVAASLGDTTEADHLLNEFLHKFVLRKES